jgi:aspartate ammonia-lyase
VLDPAKADASVAACREIREGELRDQFIVDVSQGGAGTSTNINADEVSAICPGHDRRQVVPTRCVGEDHRT